MFHRCVWMLAFSSKLATGDILRPPLSGIHNGALPEGFTTETSSTNGPELTWTPNKSLPVLGGSRVEFRLGNKEVLGYPLFQNGKYRFAMPTKDKKTLLTADGQKNLQVWLGGRRVDGGGTTVPAATAITTSTDGYETVLQPTPTVPVNPAALGSYQTKRLTYDLDPLTIMGFPASVEVVAEVTQPIGASGKRSMVLFLHGRHSTCYGTPTDPPIDDFFYSGCNFGWPCIAGCDPIPSHQGYRYIADILASQGHLVVSIAANGINGQDDGVLDAGASARSILIRHHLLLWSKWHIGSLTDPWGGTFKGKVNMDKVVLVGHSRGGEGTNRAAIDATVSDPFKIVGLMSFGPTAFGRQVTPDITSATILPTCDGDVYDLQGQAYVDESRDVAYSVALRSAVIAVGANHNFFNSEWTPGQSVAPSWDDWEWFDYEQSDPNCGSNGTQRLSAVEQQKVGATYTAALVRLAVNQDVTMLPILDGSFVRPASIGRAEVATSATGGAAFRILYRPEDDGSPTLLQGMEGAECVGVPTNPLYYGDDTIDDLICGEGSLFSPHWLPMYYSTRPASKAMQLSWSDSSDAYASFAIANSFGDLSSLDRIDVRVANDPNRIGAELSLSVLDNKGRKALLGSDLAVIQGWPGSYVPYGDRYLDRAHARTLRGDLVSVDRTKVDLTHIVAVILQARSASGRVWVIDISASQAKFQTPAVLDLPVISVESLSVVEGKGINEAQLKISSNKPFISAASIWLDFIFMEGYQIDIPAGSDSVVKRIPYKWVGDSTFSYSNIIINEYLLLTAVKGAVTGAYIGTLTVIEDDPRPKLTVVAKNVTGIKGGSLRWRLKLSSPMVTLNLYAYFTMPGGTELNTNDVDRNWLQEKYYFVPDFNAPLTLSEFESFWFIVGSIPYGVLEYEFVLPLTDTGYNVEKSVRLELVTFDDIVPFDKGIILNGKVTNGGGGGDTKKKTLKKKRQPKK